MNGLASYPANSASIEREFSTLGLVWSKLYKRLGREKIQKLVTMHKFLNNKEELKDVDECHL